MLLHTKWILTQSSAYSCYFQHLQVFAVNPEVFVQTCQRFHFIFTQTEIKELEKNRQYPQSNTIPFVAGTSQQSEQNMNVTYHDIKAIDAKLVMEKNMDGILVQVRSVFKHTSMFSLILDSVTDFGRTTIPRWRRNLNSTCNEWRAVKSIQRYQMCNATAK